MAIIMIEHWLDGAFEEVGLPVSGSPNRFVRRNVFKSLDSGECYVVEGVDLPASSKRIRQAEILEELFGAGNEKVVSWMRTREGRFGIYDHGLFWQCRKYVPCNELPRDSYALDAWRGIEAARFLKGIMPYKCQEHPFYVTDYIHRLMHVLEKESPALHGDLGDVLAALKLKHEDEGELPLVFCHGDFHPGNILWGDKCINAVIDWEFCGPKPICYDAANLLGCIGVDNPDWLSAPMASAFLKELKLPPFAENMLLKYIVALRFAWMREWWHLKDKDMIVQELDFMWIVISMLG